MSDSLATGKSLNRGDLVAALRRMQPELSGLGVSRVALFGSRARGDGRDDSDIDLIIDVVPHRKFSLLDLVGVEQVVADRLGLIANVFLRRSLEPDFLEAARRDAMIVFDAA